MSGNSNTTVFEKDTGYRRQHGINFLMPFVLFVVVFFVMPTDLFSTALWYDAQGWNKVLTSQVNIDTLPLVFWRADIVGMVSLEGTIFSLMMMAVQMLMTAIIYESGPWVNGQNIALLPALFGLASKKNTRIRLDTLNAGKFMALAAWIGLVIFDGYTSIQFRGSNGVQYSLMALIVFAIMYENVMSEILFGESLRRTVNLIPTLFELVPILIAWVISEWNLMGQRIDAARTDKRPKGGGFNNNNRNNERPRENRPTPPPNRPREPQPTNARPAPAPAPPPRRPAEMLDFDDDDGMETYLHNRMPLPATMPQPRDNGRPRG